MIVRSKVSLVAGMLLLNSLVLSPVFAGNSLPDIPQKNLYFLSPHSDDIPLTFGGLIDSEKGFPGYAHHYTIFFGNSDWTGNDLDLQTDRRVNEITLMRIQEDRDALTYMFGGWRNLDYMFHGYFEAPLRGYVGPRTAGGGPGGNFSTFRPQEKALFEQIYEDVKPVLMKDNCAAFLLMANGYHIDHFILREAVIKAAHDLGDQARCQIYFGEDQPYTGANPDKTGPQIQQFSERLGLVPLTYSIDVNKKASLFNTYYISQYDPTYVPALTARAKVLNNGERIYFWPMANYKNAKTDPTCTKDFCKLS